MNNKLNYLIIHCTATPEGRAVSKDDIIRWHTSPVHLGGRGWNRPGYSDIIYLDGELVNIIPFNTDDFVDQWEISNGVVGLNGNSRHIVYAGGMDKEGKTPLDTRTKEQAETLEVYVKYILKRHPKILMLGHNEAPNAHGKACPSFDVAAWLRAIGVKEENIYRKTDEKKNQENNAATAIITANTNEMEA
jgi:N-acetylmuramoyl-L-alanine amidase